MIEYKYKLKTLDGSHITERTGTDMAFGTSSEKPKNYTDFFLVYDPIPSIGKDPSPGVIVACDIVENIGNEYKIIANNGRRFLATLIDGGSK